ncbi:MAG: hypothetical protein GY795_21325 [Desulfobacterales bacterium]|nr:hypothetical protein [Desulfobacterales bacterium]
MRYLFLRKPIYYLGIAVILAILISYGASETRHNHSPEKSSPEPENIVITDTAQQEPADDIKEDEVEDGETEEELSLDQIIDFYASEDAPERSTGYSTISHRFLDITNHDIDRNLYRFIDDVIIGETKIQLEYNCPEYQNFLRGGYSDTEQETADATVILKTMDQLFRTNVAIFNSKQFEKRFGKKNIESLGYEIVQKDNDNDRIILRRKRKPSEKTVKYIDPELISPYVIDEKSKNLGFRYKQNLFYDKGLTSKELDCDNMVINYLGPAEVMRLPLYFVPGMRHAYLAWRLSDGQYIFFEATSGLIKPESSYVKTDTHRKQKKMGYYFNPLSRDETVGEAYWIRGFDFFQSGDYFNAARDFCKAVKLNPLNDRAYMGAGHSFRKLSYHDEAKLFHEKAFRMRFVK